MDTLPLFGSESNTPLKHCTGPCGRELPATTEFFPPRRNVPCGLYPRCRECQREVHKAYRRAHPEKARQYQETNADRIKAYKQQYQQTHREQRKLYDEQHKERIYELRKKRAQEKKDLISEQHRQFCQVYYKTERGRLQMRTSTANRRARKRNAQGTHTTEELYQQLQRQKSRCYYCHKQLGKSRNSWVAEHIIPLGRGGSNTIDNIVIACTSCNLSKGYKLPHEWEGGGKLL